MKTVMHDERPLDTQTAAPPLVPPRPPRVGTARADEDWRAEFDANQQQLAALIAQCDLILDSIDRDQTG